MNDRVLVKHEGNGWIEAVVVALWSKVPNSTSKAPYLVKLNTVTTVDSSLRVASDSIALIRKLQANALDNVLFAIKCGDNASEVEHLANQYQLDFSLVSKRMLLETAIVGNISVAEWLLMTYHRDEDSYKIVVDDKGRNLVHLSIHHKQYDYVLDLIVNPWEGGENKNFEKIEYWSSYHPLTLAVDGLGNNILHYAVLAGDVQFLAHILSIRVQREKYYEVRELCNEYDYAAVREGKVMGLDQRANSSDKTPRDLALSRGRKDMMELFDKFHKRVVLTYIANDTLLLSSSEEGKRKFLDMLKKYKALVKSTFTTIGPAQYLQEDSFLNDLFRQSVYRTVLNSATDLFIWFMKEFKVRLDALYQTLLYDNILNGCMTTRPYSQGNSHLIDVSTFKIATSNLG